jgi:hypothetical protein
MVRALLDGSKTQTRRLYKPRFHPDIGCELAAPELAREPEDIINRCCPYGKPGHRLYVRETWAQNWNQISDDRMDRSYAYRASSEVRAQDNGTDLPWRPSIHMPRAASRILLEIVAVRVERLNDCSEADAMAEGVMQLGAEDFERPMERVKDGWKLCPKCAGTGLHSALGASGGVIYDVDCRECDTHAKLYRHLWESINGPDSWAANPWVWVVEFKRVMP